MVEYEKPKYAQKVQSNNKNAFYLEVKKNKNGDDACMITVGSSFVRQDKFNRTLIWSVFDKKALDELTASLLDIQALIK